MEAFDEVVRQWKTKVAFVEQRAEQAEARLAAIFNMYPDAEGIK